MKFLKVQIEAWKKPVSANPYEDDDDDTPITEINTEDLVSVISDGAINPDDIQFLMAAPRDNRTFCTMKNESSPITLVGCLNELCVRLEEL